MFFSCFRHFMIIMCITHDYHEMLKSTLVSYKKKMIIMCIYGSCLKDLCRLWCMRCLEMLCLFVCFIFCQEYFWRAQVGTIGKLKNEFLSVVFTPEILPSFWLFVFRTNNGICAHLPVGHLTLILISLFLIACVGTGTESFSLPSLFQVTSRSFLWAWWYTYTIILVILLDFSCYHDNLLTITIF